MDERNQSDTPEQTSNTSRYYVYTLARPDGSVFYVGKGVGDRILDHEKEARQGGMSQKCRIILDIWARGGQVVKTKVAFFMTNEEAVQYEQALISSLRGLTNIVEGTTDFQEVSLSPEDRRYFGASIRRKDGVGQAYWSAREMANFLGYSRWDRFEKLVARVEMGRRKAGFETANDFKPATYSILIGGDARREVRDIHLSRTGFLLTLMNADPTKMMVTLGKGYVARQVLRVTSGHQATIPRSEPFLSHLPKQKLRSEPLPPAGAPTLFDALPDADSDE